MSVAIVTVEWVTIGPVMLGSAFLAFRRPLKPGFDRMIEAPRKRHG